MVRPLTIDVHDWRFRVDGTELRFRPSPAMIGRQALFTLLAAVFALLLWFAMPANSGRGVAAGVLLALGALPPLLAPFARVTLVHDGPPGHGTLTTRLCDRLPPRRVTLDTRRVALIGVHAQRLATSRDHAGAHDHGWVWRVFPVDDAGQPLLKLLVDHSPTLPARGDVLPDRVRDVVRYLEAVTAKPHAPPLETDVLDVDRGLLATTFRLRHRAR